MTARTEWSGSHPDKDQLRHDIWARLVDNQAVHTDPVGHIPNFIGAAAAADQLAELEIWQRAAVVKCNPDKPQMPARLRALREGKRLYMAVPRLTDERCFVELSAIALQSQGIDLEVGAIAKTALQVGKLVRFEQMQPIDLVLVGCVAVAANGGRTGKGAGFADLELAMLQQFGLIGERMAIATTVHPLQIVEPQVLPMSPHDWAVDWIVTSTDVMQTQVTHSRPTGLDWQAIRPEQYRQIPILQKLRMMH
jgi:5-formyltetrahydrofolate cyclo-ligase